MASVALLATAVAAAAKHLGVGHAVLVGRAERLAANLAANLEQQLERTAEQAAAQAVEHLAGLTVGQLASTLAEGPTEQTRALLAPEAVQPHAHQGVGGHEEPTSHEEAAEEASGVRRQASGAEEAEPS